QAQHFTAAGRKYPSRTRSNMTGRERVKVLILVLLGLMHVFVSLYAVIPGYLSMDEPTYHMMVKNYSEGRGFEIWNGYREYPSPELASAWLVPHNGSLVSGYPYLHPLLGLPFYRVWGFRGLFVLNALAFVGVVALCLALAKKLFSDLNLALTACFIFVLATFVWEYSQAAWTHMTALLFNLGSFFLCYLSIDSEDNKKAAGFAFASGMVAGFGVGIRLDFVFVLACLVLILLAAKTGRRPFALVFIAGALPGMTVLSVTNFAKYGTYMPFVSAPPSSDALVQIRPYLPLLAGITVIGVSAWLAHRFKLLHLIRQRKSVAVTAICLFIGTALAIPSTRALLWDQIVGTYTLVIDLRLLPPEVQERAMLRSPGRGILYIGGLKKSLLQSCPYLVMLALPALALWREKKDSLRLAILFLIPAAYVTFYSQFSWHGGLCLNLRYFTPILPFTSILAAYAFRELSPGFDRRWRVAISIGLLVACIGFLLRGWFLRSPAAAEFFFLTVPLILAGALLVLILLVWRDEETRHRLRRTTGAVCVAAMVWSGLVAFSYDYPLAQRARLYNLNTGLKTASLVAPDSIFFANSLDRFFALIESDRVRIARPTMDDFHDFPLLVEFHLAAGHRVYAAFQPRVWRSLRNGPLVSFEITPIWSPLGFTMAEISAATDSTLTSQPE
ncbi:MAG: hypothetical protein WBH75_14735, partial [Thermoanaerobaculia bacterium]